MTDLEVPADFDWKGSQNAKVKIASQSTATISVFLEENCNEEALMLRMDVDANTSKLELPIEIPAYIKNVYVKYGNGSEIQTVLLKVKPSQRIFNVGNKEGVSIRKWVELCYAVGGKKV